MGLTGLSSGFAYLSKLSHLCSEASQQPWHFGSGGPLLWALGPLDTGALPILHTPGVTAKTACRHGPAERQPLIATEAGLDSDSAFAQESLVVSCAAVSLGPHTRGLFVPPQVMMLTMTPGLGGLASRCTFPLLSSVMFV